eukprot:7979065-Alexandrium_andersonii.AAC.1
MCGPGDYDLEACLPPGTQRLDCTYAPSGHMMLPCAEFGQAAREPRGDGAFNLQKPVAFPVSQEARALEAVFRQALAAADAAQPGPLDPASSSSNDR